MINDDKLIFEAFQKGLFKEPHHTCEYAAKGCKCGECKDCSPIEGGPEAVLKNTGPGENAENTVVKEGDFFEAWDEKYVCVGVEEVDGKMMVHGVMLADAGDTIPMSEVKKID